MIGLRSLATKLKLYLIDSMPLFRLQMLASQVTHVFRLNTLVIYLVMLNYNTVIKVKRFTKFKQ